MLDFYTRLVPFFCSIDLNGLVQNKGVVERAITNGDCVRLEEEE